MQAVRVPQATIIMLAVTASAVPLTAAPGESCSWIAPGLGMNGEVLALTLYDGSGTPALYAGGWFTIAAGITAQRVAR
jgi:hypothetical protein